VLDVLAFAGGFEPDVGAFLGGVQTGLAVAVIVVALLGAASLVRRVIGA